MGSEFNSKDSDYHQRGVWNKCRYLALNRQIKCTYLVGQSGNWIVWLELWSAARPRARARAALSISTELVTANRYNRMFDVVLSSRTSSC